MSKWLAMALVAGLLALAPASSLAREPGQPALFATPGEAAYCIWGLVGPPSQFVCWTPNDGFTVQMTTRGRPRKYYDRFARGDIDRHAPILRFGQKRRFGGIVCSSRSTGLTCTNRRRHGWHLGRYVGYRLF